MKKLITADVLAVLAFAGAHYVQYFTDRKLGFVRWLNFNSVKLHEKFPLETIKYTAAIIIVVLAVLSIALLIKRKTGLKVYDWLLMLCTAAAAVYYVYATAVIVYEVTPCSFLLVPLIGLGTLLFAVRNLARASMLRRERSDKAGAA